MIHATLFEVCCIGAALFVASNLWFYLRVLRPLRQLAFQAEQLTQGKFDSFEQPCGGIVEVRQLRRAMVGMVSHVRRAQEQRRAFTDRLAEGQETERKRIARELHDDTMQSVIALTQSIDLAKSWVRSDVDRALQMLQLAREGSVEIVNSLRQLIGGLRPPALEELGLVAALQMHVEKIEQPETRLSITGNPRRLDEARELTLFRAAQEALTNVTRHSRADRVEVKLDYRDHEVLLSVVDNGQGFHPPQNVGDLTLANRYGLLGIHERVTNLHGRVTLQSDTEHGTTLEVCLPTVEVAQPEHLVRDPVCSALIEPQQAYGSLIYEQSTYYFCCPVCQGAFQKDPAAYHEGSATT